MLAYSYFNEADWYMYISVLTSRVESGWVQLFILTRIYESSESVHSVGRLAMASHKLTRENQKLTRDRKYRNFESIFMSLIYFAGPPFLINVVFKSKETNIVRELLCICIRNGCSYLVWYVVGVHQILFKLKQLYSEILWLII